ncbi:MAG: hypothetical protein QXG97_03455 [Nitrososphaerota archaeon]
MGGKKKLSLKQMEKVQAKQDQQEKKVKSGGAPPHAEKKVSGISLPDPRDEKVIKELQRMNVLTPYTVASRFDLRLSVAKDFLEELHRQGIVAYVSGGRSLKIYKPLNSSK